MQRTVLRKQRTVRRTACTAGTKDGAADGAAGAKDSAADGLHSGGKGQCGKRPAQKREAKENVAMFN